MIFSKKLNIILLSVVILFSLICAAFTIRINIMYAPAKLVTNDQDNSITWLGCKVTPVEKAIYTVEEFEEAYPDEDMFHYLTTDEKHYQTSKCRIVVYKVNVQNNNDSQVRFTLTPQAKAEAQPSMWSNGLELMKSDSRIAAGESKILTGCALYGPSLVHANHLKTIEHDQFQLVFSYYPEKIVLKFD